MAPPFHHRGRDGSRQLRQPIYWFVIVSCISTALVFMFFKNPSITSPPCYCHQPFLPISCPQIDQEMIKEVRKKRLTLIKEGVELVKTVNDENMKQYKILIENAKKTSSQYQKEANNCNLGVRTCEQARERAQQHLLKEHQLTILWQKRAHMLQTP